MRLVLRHAAVFVLVGAGAVVPATTFAATPPLCGGVPATILGTSGDDTIIGTDGDDVIFTFAGDDYVSDKGGDDLICTSVGADDVWTGPGNDLVWTGAGRDWIVIGEGNDIVRAGDDADQVFMTPPTAGIPEIWAGPGDDEIVGDRSDGVSVFGGNGEDLLALRSEPGASLSLEGGLGDDYLNLHLSDGDGPAQVYLDMRARKTWFGAGNESSAGTFKSWQEIMLFGNHDYTYRGTNDWNQLRAQDGSLTAYMYGGQDQADADGPGPHFIDGGADDDYGSVERRGTCVSIEFGDCSPNGYRTVSPEHTPS